MRHFLLFCILIVGITATIVPSAQGSDLDFLRNLKQDNYGERATRLDVKHISDQEVENYVSGLLANLFNIDGGMIEVIIEEQKRDFDETGLNNLIAFFKEYDLVRLNTEYYTTISTIITQQPVILNQAPLDGSYRWLVEATIMISLHNNNTESAKYSKAQRDKLFEDLKMNKKEYVVQLQVRRDPQSTNNDQILIEHFAATLME